MNLSYYFKRNIYSVAIFFFLVFGIYQANAYQKCDSIKSCLGSALYITKTSGKGAQYVDVPMTKSLRQIRDSMTVEMWIYPERQPGTTQFVAGIWGPGEDVNDSWVIYLTPDDSLVFELNGSNTDLKEFDNTKAVAYAGNLFNKWTHITAVFDGSRQTAYLYISGVLVDSARNEIYPLSRLRRTQDNLPLQIGSSNRIASLIYDGAGGGGYVSSTTVPVEDTWYHIVITHNASDTKSILYVNGNNEKETTAYGLAYRPGTDTVIGRFYTNSSGIRFKGIIDEVRIYNRALSEDEVKELYNKGMEEGG